jgi:hypothetical protein
MFAGLKVNAAAGLANGLGRVLVCGNKSEDYE